MNYLNAFQNKELFKYIWVDIEFKGVKLQYNKRLSNLRYIAKKFLININSMSYMLKRGVRYHISFLNLTKNNFQHNVSKCLKTFYPLHWLVKKETGHSFCRKYSFILDVMSLNVAQQIFHKIVIRSINIIILQ